VARILVAGFCAVPGPHRVGTQIPHVLRALSSRHKVEVITVRRGDQAYVEQFRKTRMLRVPVGEGTVIEQIESFRRALRRQLEGADYDLVHFRDGWSGIPILAVRDRLKLRTVFDVARGPMAQAPIPDEALARQLARDEAACIASSDLILAPTEAAARYLSAKGGGDRVRLVPPGVDVDTFDWDHAPGHGPMKVLYAGMLRRGRGIRVLLRAMVEVASRTDARLVLCGPVDSGFRDVLRTDIEQFGLTDRVDLVGTVDNEDMPRVIAQATVCVAPEALELARRPTALYPTKLLEFMACRRVVVAPRRGTVTMLVTDNEHGLLFKPGDATDLAAQILRLLADPQLRDRMARAGYERVRQRHTASATRRELLIAYAPLVADLPETIDTDARAALAPGQVRDGDDTNEVTASQLEPLAVSGELPARGEPSETDSGLLFNEPTVITGAPTDDLTNVEVVAPSDETWVVEHGPLAGEGTDTRRHIVAGTFAVGEVEVPTPADGTSLLPRDGDGEEGGFTAAGPLLGSAARSPDPGTGEIAIDPGTGETSPAPDSD